MLRCALLIMFLASPVPAAETYDLIFRMGTLSDVPESRTLTYDRQVEIVANPEYAMNSTGTIELKLEPNDVARLRFLKDGGHRTLGSFPASVGNPIIMYFVESVLRDVASETGGSPFYIRNRIKEALVADTPIEDKTVLFGTTNVEAKRITLHPLQEDRNRGRMGVYADLAVTFTMSDDVPGWYVSLVATAAGKDGAPGYSNTLTLMPGQADQ